MFCGDCQKDLLHCTCEDREERFKRILECPQIIIGDSYRRAIEESIEKRKQEKTVTE